MPENNFDLWHFVIDCYDVTLTKST
jgi:hypothetical protein